MAAALRRAHLASVPDNPFYDAAVRSMALSWHNFLFGAFDPSARLAVDKPPLDLWLQVACVKLFGFNSVRAKLPEALGGDAAVALLYDLVRGCSAGAPGWPRRRLAVLPVAVFTSRSDTMDTVMSRSWSRRLARVGGCAEAAREPLYLAAVAVGSPSTSSCSRRCCRCRPDGALLAAAPHAVRRRVGHLLVAGLVLVAVSLSWVSAVSLAPSADRPYAIGSSNGSAWNSMFVFDGVHRLGLGGGDRHGHPSDRARRARVGAAALPPACWLRDGPALGLRAGSELVPALLLGALALVAGAVGARGTGRWARDAAGARSGARGVAVDGLRGL